LYVSIIREFVREERIPRSQLHVECKQKWTWQCR